MKLGGGGGGAQCTVVSREGGRTVVPASRAAVGLLPRGNIGFDSHCTVDWKEPLVTELGLASSGASL